MAGRSVLVEKDEAKGVMVMALVQRGYDRVSRMFEGGCAVSALRDRLDAMGFGLLVARPLIACWRVEVLMLRIRTVIGDIRQIYVEDDWMKATGKKQSSYMY